MEPRVQYAPTSDGVRIAYYTLGEGKPLLLTPPLTFSHLILEWEFRPLREWYLHLARSRKVVRFDPRCNGLSDRGVPDVSQAAEVRDIEAVVQRLGMGGLGIVAFPGTGISAVEFAALHPDRVQRLILGNPVVRYIDPSGTPVGSLLEQDYELFCETFAHSVLGWTSGPVAHAFAQFLAASVSKDDLSRIFSAIPTQSAAPYMHRVAARTLIIYSAQGAADRYAENAREIASAISSAQVVPLRYEPSALFESPRVRKAIDEFLDISAPPPPVPDDLSSGTAIILFADIADSTALTERLGDAAFREKARELDSALRTAISSNGGTAIKGKVLGDGVLATFSSAREAIGCASACHEASRRAGLLLHVGMHAGDVIRDDNNVYGGAVNTAARVAGEAAAGETLVSATVRELAKTSAGVSFDDRGEHGLKGIDEPVRLYEVRWRKDA